MKMMPEKMVSHFEVVAQQGGCLQIEVSGTTNALDSGD